MTTDREVSGLWALRQRPDAPLLERSQAEAMLFGHFADSSRASELSGALPQSMGEASALAVALEKAVAMHNRPHGAEGPSGSGHRTLYRNPNVLWSDLKGVRPRRGQLPPEMLLEMSRSNPIYRAALQILNMRLQRHLKPMRMSPRALLTGMEGYDLRPAGKPDYEELTPAEEARRLELVSFFRFSGDLGRFEGRAVNSEDLEREPLRQVGSMYVNARFGLDQFVVERELTRNGRSLSGYYVLPGETIHRVDPVEWALLEHPEAVANPTARFVQVIDSQIVTSYGSADLLFDYVNAMGDLDNRGYGMSEAEMTYRLSVGMLNVLSSNNAIFDRNAIPPVILQLRGNVSNAQLTEMSEEWSAFQSGAGGRWGFPFFNIKDTKGGLEAVQLKSQPSDMVMSDYSSLMIALTASTIGLDAGELNAAAFGGSASNLGGGSSTEARLEDSRNRAFLPMLDRFEESLNLLAQEELDGWELKFLGRNKMDEKLLWDSFQRNMTVDEVRTSLLGLPPLGGLQGGALSNNSAVSQMSLASLKSGAATMDGEGRLVISEAGEEVRGEDKVPDPKSKPEPKGPRGKTMKLQRDD